MTVICDLAGVCPLSGECKHGYQHEAISFTAQGYSCYDKRVACDCAKEYIQDAAGMIAEHAAISVSCKCVECTESEGDNE